MGLCGSEVIVPLFDLIVVRLGEDWLGWMEEAGVEVPL